MSNEIIFIIQTLLGLAVVLAAFRMGKTWLYGLIAVNYVLANIFVTKTITLFGFEATGGNVLYGAIFLSTDLLSEYYGKEAARKGVYIGLAATLFYLVMSQFMLSYTASPNDWGPAEGMKSIFGFAPSIVLASVLAYLISQLHDVWAFHMWKEKFRGKYLWLRNNLSTVVSQLLDSLTFAFLAFSVFPRLFMDPESVLPMSVVWQIVFTTYILKLLVAGIDTPFIYLSRRLQKKDD
ncbi:MAG: queuosine precursor transporter [Candidatus Marinimicrobia bacterium]|nr:queuosine precursor transporter [Candidatus Neomarinimicrobiota bacterium]MCF7851428.1 queuosine precursor transporter [Candidatus Neomarinimicrobiota bacterium]MCF7904957.1 queuosine precursor transporter [Candidatus Neomarinimicrobiota bacterium]